MPAAQVLSSLLALAPAPRATAVEPDATESLRTYEGPRSIAAPLDAGTTPAIDRAGPTGDATEAGPSEAIVPDTIDPPEVTRVPSGADPAPRPEPPPRLLTTMTGVHPGEAARWRARGKYVTFVPGLQLRGRVGVVTPFSLDSEGNAYDEGLIAGGRVRWNPTLGFGRGDKVKLVGMVDVVSGPWMPQSSSDPVIAEILDAGDPPGPPYRHVDPRELYLEVTTRAGLLRLGQMSFTWGLGLVANDGNNLDRFGDLRFGDDGDGNLQERVLFATKPLARSGGPGKDVIFALGADLVFRDPNADLLRGDLAGQGFIVVRYEPEHRPHNWIGAYAVYRHQRSADDEDVYPGDDLLEVGVIDFAGQGHKRVRGKLALVGAFEAVAIAGRTTFLRGEFSEHQVLQGAAALRAYLGNPEVWLAGFDAGWASGDANPDDQEVNNFTANGGYTAGLLLFQYVHGWQSARGQLRAEDPASSGVPQNGTQYLPTDGSFTNAVYVQPKGRWAFRDHFEVWGGPLVAASAVPLVDPFETALAGGAPTNALGGASERRYLGTELDLGIRGRYGFRHLWVQAGLQGGVLFPGGAFEDADGNLDGPIWGGWARLELRY